ncbi:MAG: DUF4116 domain-containing protein [Parachlamydiaceae bacterium]|nr:DUF4116 domain-containing protein [Parachlamydiaceae bacterium]
MSASIQIIQYNDLPKQVHFEIENGPIEHLGRYYWVMTATKEFTKFQCLIKLITFITLTIFTLGSAMYFVTYLWHEGRVGNVKIKKYVDDESIPEKKRLLAEIKDDWINIIYASKEMHRDKDVMLAAIKKCQGAFEWAEEELKTDKEFLLLAIQINDLVMPMLTDDQQNDREFVLKAVKLNGLAIRFLDKKYGNDREIMEEAIKQNSVTIIYASDELQNELYPIYFPE